MVAGAGSSFGEVVVVESGPGSGSGFGLGLDFPGDTKRRRYPRCIKYSISLLSCIQLSVRCP